MPSIVFLLCIVFVASTANAKFWRRDAMTDDTITIDEIEKLVDDTKVSNQQNLDYLADIYFTITTDGMILKYRLFTVYVNAVIRASSEKNFTNCINLVHKFGFELQKAVNQVQSCQYYMSGDINPDPNVIEIISQITEELSARLSESKKTAEECNHLHSAPTKNTTVCIEKVEHALIVLFNEVDTRLNVEYSKFTPGYSQCARTAQEAFMHELNLAKILANNCPQP